MGKNSDIFFEGFSQGYQRQDQAIQEEKRFRDRLEYTANFEDKRAEKKRYDDSVKAYRQLVGDTATKFGLDNKTAGQLYTGLSVDAASDIYNKLNSRYEAGDVEGINGALQEHVRRNKEMDTRTPFDLDTVSNYLARDLKPEELPEQQSPFMQFINKTFMGTEDQPSTNDPNLNEPQEPILGDRIRVPENILYAEERRQELAANLSIEKAQTSLASTRQSMSIAATNAERATINWENGSGARRFSEIQNVMMENASTNTPNPPEVVEEYNRLLDTQIDMQGADAAYVQQAYTLGQKVVEQAVDTELPSFNKFLTDPSKYVIDSFKISDPNKIADAIEAVKRHKRVIEFSTMYNAIWKNGVMPSVDGKTVLYTDPSAKYSIPVSMRAQFEALQPYFTITEQGGSEREKFEMMKNISKQTNTPLAQIQEMVTIAEKATGIKPYSLEEEINKIKAK